MGWQHHSWGISKEMGVQVLGADWDNPLHGVSCAGHPKDWTSIYQKQFKRSCFHHGQECSSELTPPSSAPGDSVI